MFSTEYGERRRGQVKLQRFLLMSGMALIAILVVFSGCATKSESVKEEQPAVEQQEQAEAEPQPQPEKKQPEKKEPEKTEPEAEPQVTAVEVDSDGDGVPDDIDRCPDTAPGTIVDAYGCPSKRGEEFKIEYTVEFDIDSARIKPEYLKDRDEAVQFMQAHPTARLTRVIVEGYADRVGTDAHNYKLSKKRAENVMQYLVSGLGIDPELIGVRAFGELYPVSTNETREGRQKNRRVLIIFEGVM